MKGPAEMCESEVKGQSNMSSSSSRGMNQPVDFSDYMWMAEEELEDFDKKCEDEFWEEYLMEQAYEDMLAEEEDTQTQYFTPPVEGQSHPRHANRNPRGRMYHSNRNCRPQQRQHYPPAALHADMSGLNINPGNSHQGAPSGAVQSVPSYQILQRPSQVPHASPSHTLQGSGHSAASLNPNAPAFIPRFPSSVGATTSQAAPGQSQGDAAER